MEALARQRALDEGKEWSYQAKEKGSEEPRVVEKVVEKLPDDVLEKLAKLEQLEKNEKILREVIANRARASAKLREVDPAVGWRDWEALCDSHCLPSAFDGVDMLALGKEAFRREVPFLNALLDKYRVKAPRE